MQKLVVLEPTVLMSPLAILGLSTLGPRLHAVIPGDGTRMWALFLPGLLMLLPRKNAMRVHPLALVARSRPRLPSVRMLVRMPVGMAPGKVMRMLNELLHLATAMKLVSVGIPECLKLLKLVRATVWATLWVWLGWKPKKTIVLLLPMLAVLSMKGPMNLLLCGLLVQQLPRFRLVDAVVMFPLEMTVLQVSRLWL